ncbi:MAG TPA: hypothetical protein VJT83_01705, partial [Chitinophagaceae bacterium]|nr:hypothetical protein [Chitinophagaceae bacterium]
KVFHNILEYLQKGTNKARLRQVGKMFMLVVNPVMNMKDFLDFLQRMHNHTTKTLSGVEGL